MPQRLNIPQFNARSREFIVAQRKQALAAKARQVKQAVPERVSVVGYMRTIQADRRDAEIMSRFARATAREASRNANN